MNAASEATSSMAGRTSSRTDRNWAFKSMNGTDNRVAGTAVSIVVSASLSIRASDSGPGPQKPRRAPGYHCPRFHVLGHDRPGTHQGAGPNCHPTQNYRPAANRSAFAHPRRDHLPVGLRREHAVGRGPGVQVVDEHDPVADEHLVLDRHPFTDERVTRNLAPGPD